MPLLQSGFRPGHSTETAALRVLSDILEAVDDGDVAALVLLDLSAAFDTVDHAILCRRLQVSYGLGGPVLEWFQSYLHGRSQYVRRGIFTSPQTWLTCGVPQGCTTACSRYSTLLLDRSPACDALITSPPVSTS